MRSNKVTRFLLLLMSVGIFACSKDDEEPYPDLRMFIDRFEQEAQDQGYDLDLSAVETAYVDEININGATAGIRSGLGKKLMQLYLDFLKEKRYRSSYLWTTHELGAAASLYKRHGFQLIEEKPSRAFGKARIEQKYELLL